MGGELAGSRGAFGGDTGPFGAKFELDWSWRGGGEARLVIVSGHEDDAGSGGWIARKNSSRIEAVRVCVQLLSACCDSGVDEQSR
jgi:hypothetical protein